MAIYAAITTPDNELLGPAVEAQFPESNFMVADGQYLISTPRLTTNQVSQRLGVPGGALGKVIVMHVANYTGWHSKDMWEWLAAQAKPNPGADLPASELS
jgi:hypothetical protein